MATIRLRGRRFSENMKAARLLKGITQEQLAQKLGVTRQGVQKIESGKHSVLLETVCRVADALGADVRDLVG